MGILVDSAKNIGTDLEKLNLNEFGQKAPDGGCAILRNGKYNMYKVSEIYPIVTECRYVRHGIA